ncbi:MAG TPA: DUF1684 domain-containing protein [Vicinamibacterales bacterium]|nr:DUF1684 domain-containing protein [Vicinamibacterales bacterium]
MRVLLLLAILGAIDPPAVSYRAEIEKSRRERVAELTAPNGWLAVQGLFWLHQGGNTAGSDPGSEIHLPARAPRRLGVFTVVERLVTFVADPQAQATVAGKPVTSYTFEPHRGESSAISFNGMTLFVIERGDRLGLRMLDPESAARKNFRGLKYFPLDPRYHFRATFVPYAKLKEVPVLNVLGQLAPMESPGYVEFVLNGRKYRLEPVYETSKHEDLFFILKDLTSRTETYEAGRYLHTPLPAGGIVDLDFNRAYNPPCAFTAFATCPLPPKENQLQVAIRAGELRYHAPRQPD